MNTQFIRYIHTDVSKALQYLLDHGEYNMADAIVQDLCGVAYNEQWTILQDYLGNSYIAAWLGGYNEVE